MSDSIAMYVVRHTEICAFPDINISRLTNKLQNRHLVLDKEFSIIHVGTNDILSLSAGEIVNSFNNLIEVVRQNSETTILISSIIPMLVNHQVTGDQVKLVNSKLKQLCVQRKVQFLHTFRPFIRNCEPRRELFAIKYQGLHLNLDGTRRLRQFFINTVAHLLKK